MSAFQPRKFVRKHIEFPVRLLSSQGSSAAPQVIACRARNFGPGGLGIDSPSALQTGQRVQVEFVLPGEKRVMRLSANVRAVEEPSQEGKPWRVGLQFIQVSPDDLTYFTNYMAGTFLLY